MSTHTYMHTFVCLNRLACSYAFRSELSNRIGYLYIYISFYYYILLCAVVLVFRLVDVSVPTSKPSLIQIGRVSSLKLTYAQTRVVMSTYTAKFLYDLKIYYIIILPCITTHKTKSRAC